MNEVKRILNYWKDINLLTPISPNGTYFSKNKYLNEKKENNEIKYLSKLLIINHKKHEEIKNLLELIYSPDKKNTIEIGFGDIKNNFLYEKIRMENDIIDNDGEKTFIFKFVIDSEKKYQENSFAISNFVFILVKNLFSKSYAYIKEKIAEFNKDMNEKLMASNMTNIENLIKTLENFITDDILKELNIDKDNDSLEKNFILKSFLKRMRKKKILFFKWISIQKI